MRLKSLYKFYQKHFGYQQSTSKKQALVYAFAIRDTIEVMEEAYGVSNNSPIENYYSSPQKHPLAVKFLENAESLASQRYTNPLEVLRYCDASIFVEQGLLSTNRRGISIPCPYAIDHDNHDVIVFTFSNFLNMTKEVDVFIGLIEEFKITHPLPKDVKYLTYWDLANGTEKTINLSTVTPETRENLLTTLNKF